MDHTASIKSELDEQEVYSQASNTQSSHDFDKVFFDGSSSDLPNKICGFCYLGENSCLGQGSLIYLDKSPDFNVYLMELKYSTEQILSNHDPVSLEFSKFKMSKNKRKYSNFEMMPGIDELKATGFPLFTEISSIFDSSGGIWAHFCCIIWSENIVFENNKPLNVDQIMFKSMTQQCHICRNYGANISCLLCQKKYHFPCVTSEISLLDVKNHFIMCQDHISSLFLKEKNVICKTCSKEIEEPQDLLTCHKCGCSNHYTCTKPPKTKCLGENNDFLAMINPHFRSCWTCNLCKSCQFCNTQNDITKFVVCDNCDKAFHSFCLKPPLLTLPKIGWRCKNCRVCSDCGSRSPGAGSSSRWHYNYTLCDSCYQSRNQTQKCAVCKRVNSAISLETGCKTVSLTSSGSVEKIMAICGKCQKYVHFECDTDALKYDFDITGYPETLLGDRRDHVVKMLPKAQYKCPLCLRSRATKSFGHKNSSSSKNQMPQSLSCSSMANNVNNYPTIHKPPNTPGNSSINEFTYSSDISSSLHSVELFGCNKDAVKKQKHQYNYPSMVSPLPPPPPAETSQKLLSNLPPTESSPPSLKLKLKTVDNNKYMVVRPPDPDQLEPKEVMKKLETEKEDITMIMTTEKVRNNFLDPCQLDKTLRVADLNRIFQWGSNNGLNFSINGETMNDLSPTKFEPPSIEDEDDEPTYIPIFLSTEDVYCRYKDMCVCCGSFGIGSDNTYVYCFQCGQSYHPFCVSIEFTAKIAFKGWRCFKCIICETCGRADDESRLILCDECDTAYHIYCLVPSLTCIPKGNWKCPKCVRCRECFTSDPGKNCYWIPSFHSSNTATTIKDSDSSSKNQAASAYEVVCGPCGSRDFCPICKKRYVNSDNEIIMECSDCFRWVHGSCENIKDEWEAGHACEKGFVCKLCKTFARRNTTTLPLEGGGGAASYDLMASNLNRQDLEGSAVSTVSLTTNVNRNRRKLLKKFKKGPNFLVGTNTDLTAATPADALSSFQRGDTSVDDSNFCHPTDFKTATSHLDEIINKHSLAVSNLPSSSSAGTVKTEKIYNFEEENKISDIIATAVTAPYATNENSQVVSSKNDEIANEISTIDPIRLATEEATFTSISFTTTDTVTGGHCATPTTIIPNPTTQVKSEFLVDPYHLNSEIQIPPNTGLPILDIIEKDTRQSNSENDSTILTKPNFLSTEFRNFPENNSVFSSYDVSAVFESKTVIDGVQNFNIVNQQPQQPHFPPTFKRSTSNKVGSGIGGFFVRPKKQPNLSTNSSSSVGDNKGGPKNTDENSILSQEGATTGAVKFEENDFSFVSAEKDNVFTPNPNNADIDNPSIPPNPYNNFDGDNVNQMQIDNLVMTAIKEEKSNIISNVSSKRKRTPKKRGYIAENYPYYLQELFFGEAVSKSDEIEKKLIAFVKVIMTNLPTVKGGLMPNLIPTTSATTTNLTAMDKALANSNPSALEQFFILTSSPTADDLFNYNTSHDILDVSKNVGDAKRIYDIKHIIRKYPLNVNSREKLIYTLLDVESPDYHFLPKLLQSSKSSSKTIFNYEGFSVTDFVWNFLLFHRKHDRTSGGHGGSVLDTPVPSMLKFYLPPNYYENPNYLAASHKIRNSGGGGTAVPDNNINNNNVVVVSLVGGTTPPPPSPSFLSSSDTTNNGNNNRVFVNTSAAAAVLNQQQHQHQQRGAILATANTKHIYNRYNNDLIQLPPKKEFYVSGGPAPLPLQPPTDQNMMIFDEKSLNHAFHLKKRFQISEGFTTQNQNVTIITSSLLSTRSSNYLNDRDLSLSYSTGPFPTSTVPRQPLKMVLPPPASSYIGSVHRLGLQNTPHYSSTQLLPVSSSGGRPISPSFNPNLNHQDFYQRYPPPPYDYVSDKSMMMISSSKKFVPTRPITLNISSDSSNNAANQQPFNQIIEGGQDINYYDNNNNNSYTNYQQQFGYYNNNSSYDHQQQQQLNPSSLKYLNNPGANHTPPPPYMVLPPSYKSFPTALTHSQFGTSSIIHKMPTIVTTTLPNNNNSSTTHGKNALLLSDTAKHAFGGGGGDLNHKNSHFFQHQQQSLQHSLQDEKSSLNAQKNLMRWLNDEALGPLATISPVLYANLKYPTLKIDIPDDLDRSRQMAKLWRNITPEERIPFLQKARENRALLRLQKSQQKSLEQSSLATKSNPTTPQASDFAVKSTPFDENTTSCIPEDISSGSTVPLNFSAVTAAPTLTNESSASLTTAVIKIKEEFKGEEQEVKPAIMQLENSPQPLEVLPKEESISLNILPTYSVSTTTNHIPEPIGTSSVSLGASSQLPIHIDEGRSQATDILRIEEDASCAITVIENNLDDIKKLEKTNEHSSDVQMYDNLRTAAEESFTVLCSDTNNDDTLITSEFKYTTATFSTAVLAITTVTAAPSTIPLSFENTSPYHNLPESSSGGLPNTLNLINSPSSSVITISNDPIPLLPPPPAAEENPLQNISLSPDGGHNYPSNLNPHLGSQSNTPPHTTEIFLKQDEKDTTTPFVITSQCFSCSCDSNTSSIMTFTATTKIDNSETTDSYSSDLLLLVSRATNSSTLLGENVSEMSEVIDNGNNNVRLLPSDIVSTPNFITTPPLPSNVNSTVETADVSAAAITDDHFYHPNVPDDDDGTKLYDGFPANSFYDETLNQYVREDLIAAPVQPPNALLPNPVVEDLLNSAAAAAADFGIVGGGGGATNVIEAGGCPSATTFMSSRSSQLLDDILNDLSTIEETKGIFKDIQQPPLNGIAVDVINKNETHLTLPPFNLSQSIITETTLELDEMDVVVVPGRGVIRGEEGAPSSRSIQLLQPPPAKKQATGENLFYSSILSVPTPAGNSPVAASVKSPPVPAPTFVKTTRGIRPITGTISPSPLLTNSTLSDFSANKNDSLSTPSSPYHAWLVQKDQTLQMTLNLLSQEIAKMRKRKKSLASRQRQLRKTGDGTAVLPPHEARELANLIAEIGSMQKKIEALRKELKQHRSLISELQLKENNGIKHQQSIGGIIGTLTANQNTAITTRNSTDLHVFATVTTLTSTMPFSAVVPSPIFADFTSFNKFAPIQKPSTAIYPRMIDNSKDENPDIAEILVKSSQQQQQQPRTLNSVAGVGTGVVGRDRLILPPHTVSVTAVGTALPNLISPRRHLITPSLNPHPTLTTMIPLERIAAIPDVAASAVSSPFTPSAPLLNPVMIPNPMKNQQTITSPLPTAVDSGVNNNQQEQLLYSTNKQYQLNIPYTQLQVSPSLSTETSLPQEYGISSSAYTNNLLHQETDPPTTTSIITPYYSNNSVNDSYHAGAPGTAVGYGNNKMAEEYNFRGVTSVSQPQHQQQSNELSDESVGKAHHHSLYKTPPIPPPPYTAPAFVAAGTSLSTTPRTTISSNNTFLSSLSTPPNKYNMDDALFDHHHHHQNFAPAPSPAAVAATGQPRNLQLHQGSSNTTTTTTVTKFVRYPQPPSNNSLLKNNNYYHHHTPPYYDNNNNNNGQQLVNNNNYNSTLPGAVVVRYNAFTTSSSFEGDTPPMMIPHSSSKTPHMYFTRNPLPNPNNQYYGGSQQQMHQHYLQYHQQQQQQHPYYFSSSPGVCSISAAQNSSSSSGHLSLKYNTLTPQQLQSPIPSAKANWNIQPSPVTVPTPLFPNNNNNEYVNYPPYSSQYTLINNNRHYTNKQQQPPPQYPATAGVNQHIYSGGYNNNNRLLYSQYNINNTHQQQPPYNQQQPYGVRVRQPSGAVASNYHYPQHHLHPSYHRPHPHPYSPSGAGMTPTTTAFAAGGSSSYGGGYNQQLFQHQHATTYSSNYTKRYGSSPAAASSKIGPFPLASPTTISSAGARPSHIHKTYHHQTPHPHHHQQRAISPPQHHVPATMPPTSGTGGSGTSLNFRNLLSESIHDHYAHENDLWGPEELSLFLLLGEHKPLLSDDICNNKYTGGVVGGGVPFITSTKTGTSSNINKSFKFISSTINAATAGGGGISFGSSTAAIGAPRSLASALTKLPLSAYNDLGLGNIDKSLPMLDKRFGTFKLAVLPDYYDEFPYGRFTVPGIKAIDVIQKDPGKFVETLAQLKSMLPCLQSPPLSICSQSSYLLSHEIPYLSAGTAGPGRIHSSHNNNQFVKGDEDEDLDKEIAEITKGKDFLKAFDFSPQNSPSNNGMSTPTGTQNKAAFEEENNNELKRHSALSHLSSFSTIKDSEFGSDGFTEDNDNVTNVDDDHQEAAQLFGARPGTCLQKRPANIKKTDYSTTLLTDHNKSHDEIMFSSLLLDVPSPASLGIKTAHAVPAAFLPGSQDSLARVDCEAISNRNTDEISMPGHSLSDSGGEDVSPCLPCFMEFSPPVLLSPAAAEPPTTLPPTSTTSTIKCEEEFAASNNLSTVSGDVMLPNENLISAKEEGSADKRYSDDLNATGNTISQHEETSINDNDTLVVMATQDSSNTDLGFDEPQYPSSINGEDEDGGEIAVTLTMDDIENVDYTEMMAKLSEILGLSKPITRFTLERSQKPGDYNQTTDIQRSLRGFVEEASATSASFRDPKTHNGFSYYDKVSSMENDSKCKTVESAVKNEYSPTTTIKTEEFSYDDINNNLNEASFGGQTDKFSAKQPFSLATKQTQLNSTQKIMTPSPLTLPLPPSMITNSIPAALAVPAKIPVFEKCYRCQSIIISPADLVSLLVLKRSPPNIYHPNFYEEPPSSSPPPPLLLQRRQDKTTITRAGAEAIARNFCGTICATQFEISRNFSKIGITPTTPSLYPSINHPNEKNNLSSGLVQNSLDIFHQTLMTSNANAIWTSLSSSLDSSKPFNKYTSYYDSAAAATYMKHQTITNNNDNVVGQVQQALPASLLYEYRCWKNKKYKVWTPPPPKNSALSSRNCHRPRRLQEGQYKHQSSEILYGAKDGPFFQPIPHYVCKLVSNAKKTVPVSGGGDDRMELDEEDKEISNDNNQVLYQLPEWLDSRVCQFCKEKGDGLPDRTSRLLNLDLDKWVHLNCALWSSLVYETLGGALMNVSQALQKSVKVKCTRCGVIGGASCQCDFHSCDSAYHFPCAFEEGCFFFDNKTILCPVHYTIQREEHKDDNVLFQPLESLICNRRVYIDRDIRKQLSDCSQKSNEYLVRMGTLVVLSIGYLLPEHLTKFHNFNYIYPVNYTVVRYFWDYEFHGTFENHFFPYHLYRRAYECKVLNDDYPPIPLNCEQQAPSLPKFLVTPLNIEIHLDRRSIAGRGDERDDITMPLLPIIAPSSEMNEGIGTRVLIKTALPDDGPTRSTSCINAWTPYLKAIANIRSKYQTLLHSSHDRFNNDNNQPAIPYCEKPYISRLIYKTIRGEDLFGMTEPIIIRCIESLPVLECATSTKIKSLFTIPNADLLASVAATVATTTSLNDEPPVVTTTNSSPIKYRFKYGRNQTIKYGAFINPTGSARSEPTLRTHFRKQFLWMEIPFSIGDKSYNSKEGSGNTETVSIIVPPGSNAPFTSSLNPSTSTTGSPNLASLGQNQLMLNKTSQYRRMKKEWKRNIFLGKSRIEGWGLFASKDFERDQMIIEYVGEIIRSEIAEVREKRSGTDITYLFKLDDQTVLDAAHSGGPARYINHSCDPNCRAQNITVFMPPNILNNELTNSESAAITSFQQSANLIPTENDLFPNFSKSTSNYIKAKKIVIVANRKIPRGEELCYDYKFEYEGENNKISCFCGAQNCKKWMN